MKRLLSIIVVTAVSAWIPALCFDVSKSKDVSFSIVSPVDNSLWIATSGRGILRVGSTGKTFSYSAEKGDFPSDSIAVLAFDEAGRLWMKDAAGRCFNYTSLDGFVFQDEVPDGLFPSVEDKSSLSGVADGAVAADVSSDDGRKAGVPAWLCVLVIVLLIAVYLAVRFLRSGRASVAALPAMALPKAEESVKPVSPLPSSDAPKPIPSTPEVVKVSKTNVSDSNLAALDFKETVIRLIDENLSNPDFSVEDIAAATGLSRVHVNRKLKAECGQSPSSLLKAARMKKAAALLEAHEVPVTEIASICGFSSQAYFSSAFKEYFGVPPSVYSAGKRY